MNKNTFAHSFWISFVLGTAVFVVGLHFLWAGDYRKLPPPVMPPIWSKSYVAAYNTAFGDGLVDYHLYNTGIFGFSDRIKGANILLCGNSHVMFGLSAGQLQEEYSAEGHPVKVFNLGQAGSNMEMVDSLVKSSGAHDQIAVMDTFSLDPGLPLLLPKAIKDALLWHETPLHAYVQVSKCWSEFWRDWLLDPYLPKLRIGSPWGESPLSFQRFLGFTYLRDAGNGDAIALWHPNQGFIFSEAAGTAGHLIQGRHKFNDMIPDDSTGGHFQADLLEARHIRPVYTLIPYDGCELGTRSADAQPFIVIAEDRIMTYDGSHLTAESRRVATERLFEGMKKLGLQVSPPSHR